MIRKDLSKLGNLLIIIAIFSAIELVVIIAVASAVFSEIEYVLIRIISSVVAVCFVNLINYLIYKFIEKKIKEKEAEKLIKHIGKYYRMIEVTKVNGFFDNLNEEKTIAAKKLNDSEFIIMIISEGRIEKVSVLKEKDLKKIIQAVQN